mgnify:CR=1 FL=1|jgi:glycosyltransferase involved in cell wall biosynthesis
MGKKYTHDATIAVINYNRAKFIDRAIRSCLDQILNFKNHEVIVVDDKSTDRSMDYMAAHKHLRNYIRVFKNKKNKGPGYCSNLAVRKAQGKYFMRVDSDDFISRSAIDIMSEILNNNPQFGYVYCDHIRTDEYGFKTEIVKLDNNKKLYAHGAGILFRTELIKKVGNYNINFREAEDHELILRLNKICKGYYLPLPLYRYYIHENNISNSGNRKKYINLIKKNAKKF